MCCCLHSLLLFLGYTVRMCTRGLNKALCQMVFVSVKPFLESFCRFRPQHPLFHFFLALSLCPLLLFCLTLPFSLYLTLSFPFIFYTLSLTLTLVSFSLPLQVCYFSSGCSTHLPLFPPEQTPIQFSLLT